MFLKRFFLSFVIFFFLGSLLSGSQLGVGIILGTPTGISFKFWQSQRNALDLALSWDFGKDYFHIHGDYLYHFPLSVEEVPKKILYTYLGIGARMKFKSDSSKNNNLLGIRGVGGLEFLARGIPLDVFLEIAPVMNIIKTTAFDLEGGIGIRYTFNL